jgi:hypothetical protein
MKALRRLYAAGHAVIALLFAVMAVMLVVIAARTGLGALAQDLHAQGALTVIEAIGLLAVAAVALQISQTVTEEEVIRQAHVSAPTRVRRYLSRFLAVVVVAVAIEGLVATLRALHEDLSRLPYAAASLGVAGVLLAGWGVFVRLNVAAEQLEPEAMEQAKDEDEKLE